MVTVVAVCTGGEIVPQAVSETAIKTAVSAAVIRFVNFITPFLAESLIQQFIFIYFLVGKTAQIIVSRLCHFNPFSGICYCADCGKKMYLCRATSLTEDQEHLKCGTYAKDKNGCTIHFIRTIVLKEIILGELNKMISFVKENEDEFIQAAMDNSVQKQSSELAKSRKKLKEAKKRIAELDRLFTRLYEDNVSGKISDERFAVMSSGYEDEQKKLRATVAELTAYIDTAEQKSADVTAFIKAVQKYEHITELTPEIMHELIEKIVVYAPDKSSGHRTQQIEIHYRFDVAVTTAVADSMKYDKKRKAA